MPYIAPSKRIALDPAIEELNSSIGSEGELTYAVCCLTLAFIKRKGIRYANMAAALGAVGLAIHEIRRRLVDGYEDRKIVENGDLIEFTEMVEE